jgi:NAD(P)-dependent dehydrogenase (short-subunit alcohol dehydrogenase family)
VSGKGVLDGRTALVTGASAGLGHRFALALAGAEATLGPVDVMVNNAGIGIPKRILDTTEEDYDRLMDTNAKGMWLMA